MQEKIQRAKEAQAQKLAEEEKRKNDAKKEEKTVKSKENKEVPDSNLKPNKKKVNSNSVIEIDFTMLEKLIAENHTLENPDEHNLWKYFFEPYEKNKGHKTVRGRNAFLWDSLKQVVTKNAKMIVKRVTREDVD